MKTLLLLRHAKSSWGKPGVKDFERPLTGKGLAAAALIGAHLVASGCIPGAIISSPARRARQTAEGVADGISGTLGNIAMKTVPDLSFDPRLYEAPVEVILEVVRSARAEVLMLVGHNPSIHMAALNFCAVKDATLRAELLEGYPTAGLVKFSFAAAHWRRISWSGATPLGFVSPKVLRRRFQDSNR